MRRDFRWYSSHFVLDHRVRTLLSLTSHRLRETSIGLGLGDGQHLVPVASLVRVGRGTRSHTYAICFTVRFRFPPREPDLRDRDPLGTEGGDVKTRGGASPNVTAGGPTPTVPEATSRDLDGVVLAECADLEGVVVVDCLPTGDSCCGIVCAWGDATVSKVGSDNGSAAATSLVRGVCGRGGMLGGDACGKDGVVSRRGNIEALALTRSRDELCDTRPQVSSVPVGGGSDTARGAR